MKLLSKWFAKFQYQEKSDMRKKRIGYVMVLIIILILTYYRPCASTSYMLYSVILLPIISLIHLLFISKRLICRQELNQLAVTRGDHAEIEVILENKAAVYNPYIELHCKISYLHTETSGDIKHLCLDAKESTNQTMLIPCMKRGCYEIGIRKIYIGDLLGIWNVAYKVGSPGMVTVLPKIIRLSYFPVGMSKTEMVAEGEGKKYSGLNGSSDIRRYQPGDQMKAIHWKLYAKKQSLWTRCSKEEVKQSIWVWIDTYEDEQEDLEYREKVQNMVIESGLGIIAYGMNLSIQSTLSYYADNDIRTVLVRDKKDFDGVYRSFCHLPFQSSLKLQEQGILEESKEEDMIILVTARLSNHVYELAKKCLNIIIVVQEHIETEEMNKTHKACIEQGIQCFISDEKIGIKPLI